MKKLFACITLVVILLTGCSEPEEYTRSKGEIIGKHISSGRYGNSYYIEVSYPVRDGKFGIDNISVERDVYDSYHIKDEVTVYGNKEGIGGIVK
jgi:hypothetical protein